MCRRKRLLQFASVVVIPLLSVGLGVAENIDPYNDGSQYAYGENVGWLNAEPLGDGGPGVEVDDSKLTGYVWGENIGWISLSCENTSSCGTVDYGVTNNGAGNLSGFAWAENVGWINFDPRVPNDPNCYSVCIDSNGNFDGWAWGENIGWIHFQSSTPVVYKVQTSWAAPGPTCWNPCQCAGQPNGDATCDGSVNLADLFALKAHFGKCAPWTLPECCADFTQDGCINLADLFGLKAGFGSSGYSPSTGNQDCPP
ncbi:MAG: hypothetical protein ACYTEL_14495 [Planctomycetota bacterium]|jgi:hypothetical protein